MPQALGQIENVRLPPALENDSPMARFKSIALLFAFAAVALPATAQTFDLPPGAVIALDGDTLRIGNNRIRLSAIDAPELSQVCRTHQGRAALCGRDARSALSRLIRQGVRCAVETVDRYGRAVATCVAPAGLDVGRDLIRQGWAVPYWRYGGARYAKAFDEARAAAVGMHAGTFIDPEQWRRGARW